MPVSKAHLFYGNRGPIAERTSEKRKVSGLITGGASRGYARRGPCCRSGTTRLRPRGPTPRRRLPGLSTTPPPRQRSERSVSPRTPVSRTPARCSPAAAGRSCWRLATLRSVSPPCGQPAARAPQSRPLLHRRDSALAASTEATAKPPEDAPPARMAASAALTGREAKVMSLVAEGLTSKQTAARLFLSPRTVDMHVRNSMIKLDCTTRAQAVTCFLTTRP